MDVEWLSDFIELSATKNFTAAAKNRNRSQPAFSRRISGLEQWVGVPLVDRSVYPLSLTEEGECFRQSAQEIVKNLQRALDKCRQHQSGKQDFIRFTALHTLAINFFSEWMSSIHQYFSLVRCTMNANNVHDCVQLLQSGQAEFMLAYSTPQVPSLFDSSSFFGKKLTTDELVLVSAATAEGQPLYTLDSGTFTNYLSYPANCFMGKMTDKLLSTECNGVSLNCIYENAMAESIKEMTLSGMGISWLPSICIKSELSDGTLVKVGGSNLSAPMDIILYRSAKRLSQQSENLWDYLSD